MEKNEIRERCVQLQDIYYEKLKKQHPEMDEIEVSIMAYPNGWFLSNNYEERANIVQKAIEENKLVADYEETFYLLHPEHGVDFPYPQTNSSEDSAMKR